MSYKEECNEFQKNDLLEENKITDMNSYNIVDYSEEILSRVIHSSCFPMTITNYDSGKFLDVNSQFLNALGYKKEEMTGITFNDIYIYNKEQNNLHNSNGFRRIKDCPILLRTKNNKEVKYLYSSEAVCIGNTTYQLNIYCESALPEETTILNDIFENLSNYLLLISTDINSKFIITNINKKAEEIEFVKKNEVIGKSIDETILSENKKLLQLLHKVRATGNSYKLFLCENDISSGFYMGYPLKSGNIIVAWEPGDQQKSIDDFDRQKIIFKSFSEMLPEMIFEVDLTGKILCGNKRGLEFFGYSNEDIIRGVNIHEIFPEDSHKMIKNLEYLKSPEDIVSNEYNVRKRDGTLVKISTHSYAIFHDDKIVGFRGVLRDISQQKEYEEQIIREKAFLEQIFNSSPSAMAITGPSGKIIMINYKFSELFGYCIDEITDKNISEIIVTDNQDGEVLKIENDGKTKITQKTIIINKNRKRLYVLHIKSAVIINGETNAYIEIFGDISIEKKNQFLHEALFNISNIVLRQYDIKDIYPSIVKELSKIWDTNNFYIALYNKNSETLSLPFFADEKDSFHEIPIKKTISGWLIKNRRPALLTEADLRNLEELNEIDLIGTPCKVWMGVPLKIEDNILGVMCLQDYNDEKKFSSDDLHIMDFIANHLAVVLQRRTMLDDIISARQKAEKAAQSKQFFMSTMSHEIRTPLNEVIGITNLLLQGNPREDQMSYLNTLKFSGNHLLTLVNDVLDYSKMESGKIAFEQTQFNLSNFLNEIIRSYSLRSKEKNLTFELKKNNNLPAEVIGDPIRLNQILSNLLSNALKFTQHGGIIISIREIWRKRNQSKLEFSITDTGIGIPKDKHALIFDNFSQATSDTTRHYGGTGLGLAICKMLIELQGGSLKLDSTPGKGSTFSFILSFGVSEQTSKLQAKESSETFTGLEGKKVLVAEDNKINFFVVNKFLTGWGIKVSHAENGQVAIDMLEMEDFNLILMDLHMPVLDGIEATRIIRNSENLKIRDIPIVALTAAIMSENHDKIDDLKIDDYILKPFKPQDLFDKIRLHIR
jgi:PAS domain S-box-containing protein